MDDARIARAAARGFKFSRKALANMEDWDDDMLEAAGFESREAFEIALEGRRPRSEASYAIQMAHERTGMRIRKAEEQRAPASIVQIVMPPPRKMTAEERAKATVIDVGEK